MNYPDDCCHRKEMSCSMFRMSCSMYHAMIAGHYDGKCLYYNKHFDNAKVK